MAKGPADNAVQGLRAWHRARSAVVVIGTSGSERLVFSHVPLFHRGHYRSPSRQFLFGRVASDMARTAGGEIRAASGGSVCTGDICSTSASAFSSASESSGASAAESRRYSLRSRLLAFSEASLIGTLTGRSAGVSFLLRKSFMKMSKISGSAVAWPSVSQPRQTGVPNARLPDRGQRWRAQASA